jgi:hypothetical protein
MRFRTRAVFGLIFCFAIAGCAAKQHTGAGLKGLSTQSTTVAALQTPYQPYGFSVGPYQASSSTQGDHPGQGNQFQFSHPRVDDFVTQFQTSLRGFYRGALSRSARYVPGMSSILQKKGVPQELAYLPLIESGYRVHAVSRAGAVGPWQLIPGTGRRYGLRIDRYVDERRDPVKSTQAAAQYLKDLHDMFGDWHLSLAAYNTGEMNIVRILERRRAESFWEMSERGYLYQETSDFVPEFLAALQIAGSPEAYGFEAPNEVPLEYDIVKINRSLSLSTVAQLSGTSTETIKELNPALHRGVVPPNGYSVRVPKGTKESFEFALSNYKSPSAPPLLAENRPGKGHRKAKAVKGVQARTKHPDRRGVAVVSKHRPAKVRNAQARRESSPIVVAKRKTASGTVN